MDVHGENEMKSFIKVWIAAIASVSYCYYIASRIPRGITRLISLLPIIYLFIILPLHISSVHLGGPTVFYLIWLGNFKLLLFSFGRGPLSSHPPLSFLHFISISLLPIKTTQNPSPQSPPKSGALLAIKVVLLAIIVRAYDYGQYLHPHVIMALYCCHVYLGVELMLAISVVLVRAALGLEIEPQFNEPYLATSLQDFWGRRWNLMVTSILRPTVYHPVRNISTRILGRTPGQLLAVFATFVVSGVMHEIIYFYLTRVGPTWEVTWFFVLHGLCTAVEVAGKKAVGDKWRLHRAVSGPLTVAFVAVTSVWLFLPQIVRNGVDLKAIKEYSIFVSFVRDQFLVYFNCPITHP